MATLVHDDLIDGARVRRGKAAAWTAYGADAARAAGDYLFARAFAELAARGDVDERRDPRRRLARARARRGDAAAAAPRPGHDRRRLPRALRAQDRASSSRPRACSAAAAATTARLLGISFQIVDDILDCAGDTIETGKIPGTDLRDGTPTLPLILAAREDEVVRAALAGGSLEGVLVRVVATGALDRSREVALDYARRARESLDGVAAPGGARSPRARRGRSERLGVGSAVARRSSSREAGR